VKIDLRWQLLLVAVCLGFVAFLLSDQVQDQGDCRTIAPSSRGRLKEGMIGRPEYVNPLLSDDNPVDSQLVSLIFEGLTSYDRNGYIVPALAESWSYSDDERTITFTLDGQRRWHDGQPVTAADVAYTYSLLQSDEFPATAGLRSFWQRIEINVIDETRVGFTLPQPYAPFLEAVTRGIVPSHILQNVPVSQIATHAFNSAPIGTGPFFVFPGSNWLEDGYMTLGPFPDYWHQGTIMEAIEFRFYPDGKSLNKAFREGEIHSISSVPHAEIDEFGAIPGMRLYTSPSAQYTELAFNLTDSSSSALQAVETRRALVLGIDRDSIIDRVLKGQALPLEGPYIPRTWAYDPTLLTAYSYRPDEAAALLDNQGWLPLEGLGIRQKEEQQLSLRLLANNLPPNRNIAQAVADYWQSLGIIVELNTESMSVYKQKLMEREFDVALLEVAPLIDPDLYDFWSQEAIIRGQNYGGWNNRRASEALEVGRRLVETDQRKPYYKGFLEFFNTDLPAVTIYQHVNTYGVNAEVEDVDIGLVTDPFDRFSSFNQWSVTSGEAFVICQENS
jgi:peptide/nickel transport system substrate-binding protein